MEILVHPILHTHLRMIGAKRTMLRSDGANLATVVLGSSHGDHGFNPEFLPDSFNLCCSSQDLRHSFLIYKHITENYKNIKNVVLFYSVFSPGWNLEKNPSEKYISAALNELFNLQMLYEDQELQSEFLKIKGRLGHLNFDPDGYRGFMPNHERSYFQDSYGATNRANDHLKWNTSIVENLHLIKLILLAKHLGHKLLIVVPPARSDYKKAINKDFNSLFHSLIEILYDFHLDCEVKLVNAFDSALFDDSCFADFDHLLPSGEGTKVLTEMIREALATEARPA